MKTIILLLAVLTLGASEVLASGGDVDSVSCKDKKTTEKKEPPTHKPASVEGGFIRKARDH